MRMSLDPRIRLTLAAAVATLLAAVSLRQLVAGWSWMVPVVAVVAVTAGVGAVLRRLGAPALLLPLAQVLALCVLVTAWFARSAAYAGVVPTGGVISKLSTLAQQGSTAIAQFAPPIPAGSGVVLLVVVGMAVVAVIVDVLSASLGHPAVAGLALLAVYCVPAALLPQGVSWSDFVLAAAGFLLLVVAASADRARSWGRVLSGGSDGGDLAPSLAGGRAVAAVALVAAVLVPMITPIGERLLTNGNGDGEGPGRGQITVVNPILNLHANLTSRSSTPVISYTTTVANPEPLRLASDDTFNGKQWTPSTGPLSRRQKVQDGLPGAPGLNSSVSRRDSETRIAVGQLGETYLPLPYPTTRVEITGRWLWEKSSLNVVGDGQKITGATYTAFHQTLSPTPEQLRAAPAAPDEIREKYLALPTGLSPEIGRLAAQVAPDGTAYDKALALQGYLRGSGRFTYSEKAPSDGDDSGQDAILAFLTVRRGYCVHFASTMAVMARTLGIPSRVGVGFLPGRRLGAGYQISLRDAHAWPELYFEGVGWVRFEPTPAARVPSLPGYAPAGGETTPDQAPSASASASSSVDSSNRASGGARRPTERATPSTTTQTGSWWSHLPWRWLSLILVPLLGLLAPGAASWLARRRRWARAATPAAAATAGWDELRDRLDDLGLGWPRSWTPRATVHRLGEDHDLSEPRRDALARLGSGVEDAWYAPPGDATGRRDADAVRRDVSTVVEGVRATVTPAARRRALLLPRSGWAVLTLAEWRARRGAAGVTLEDDAMGSADDDADGARTTELSV